MIIGWGASMIFGIALHFLPRLRGQKLIAPSVVPWAFYLFASGTILRVFGQPFLAWYGFSEKSLLVPILFGGVSLQTAGIVVILILLFLTFQKGPPIQVKKGFLQIVPPLAIAGLAFFLAQASWIWVILSTETNNFPLFPHALNRTSVEILLFGAVVAISFAMSARLFPLSFRIQHASQPLLWTASFFLLIGVLLTATNGFALQLPAAEGIAALAFSCGVGFGIPAIRVWHKRTPFPGKKRIYRLSRDPAGLGVLSAYCWAAVAAIFLLFFSLQTFENIFPGSPVLGKDLALHGMGAGFMTILIISVGWNMLPGFAGGTPRGQKWFIGALILANLAALLRIIPGTILFFTGSEIGRTIYYPTLATAGIFGFFAIIFFARALAVSWKKEK